MPRKQSPHDESGDIVEVFQSHGRSLVEALFAESERTSAMNTALTSFEGCPSRETATFLAKTAFAAYHDQWKLS